MVKTDGYVRKRSNSAVLLCPRHKMAEGHIESYLSVCVCMCLCVPELFSGHHSVIHDGL